MEDTLGGMIILIYILSNVINLFIATRKYYELRKSGVGQFIFFFGTGTLQIAFTFINLFLMIIAGFSGVIFFGLLFLMGITLIYSLPWVFLRAIKSYVERHGNTNDYGG